MFNSRLLFILATTLCFLSFVCAQVSLQDQYLSNDEYWYATGVVKKTIDKKYILEARTHALAGIAKQISSSIAISESKQTSITWDKTTDYGIAESDYLGVIESHTNATIEFDVEDVFISSKEVPVGKEYRHTVRLNKEKYFNNREEKRNNAINKSASTLKVLDSFPSRSAINSLNYIVETLLPYKDEPLEYELNPGEKVNLLAHSISLARNYLDRITFRHSIEEYPLINISDNFLFNIYVYDRVTGQPLSNFQIIDKNTKKEKKLFSDNKGIISVKGKVSKKRSKFLYTIDYQSIFPDFIIFPLGKKDYLIEESIFRKPQPPSFNFVLHEESKKISRSGLDILQKDLRKNLSKEYRAIFNKSDNPDYKIVINISYDNFKKNQYGRYVCSVSVVYSLLNNKNDEITDFSIRGIKGMSRTSKDDALKQAAYKIDNLIKEGSNGIFHKFSEAIHNF